MSYLKGGENMSFKIRLVDDTLVDCLYCSSCGKEVWISEDASILYNLSSDHVVIHGCIGKLFVHVVLCNNCYSKIKADPEVWKKPSDPYWLNGKWYKCGCGG